MSHREITAGIHLVEVSEQPNIDLRVLPFGAGAHASPEGPFTIFDMPEPYPTVAYVETRGGAVYVEGDKVGGFEHAYDHMKTAALQPKATADLIASLARR